MANTRGNGQIIQTTAHGPYAYLWKGNSASQVWDDVVNAQTFTSSYSGITGLLAAMPGSILSANLVVSYDNGVVAEAKIAKSATNGPYAYIWRADAGTTDVTTTVTGKTLAQAASEVFTLVTTMSGTINRAVLSGVSG